MELSPAACRPAYPLIRHAAALALGLLVVLLAAACSGSATPDTGGPAAAPPTAAFGTSLLERSPGCGTAGRSGDFTLSTTDGAARPRTYLVHVPADYSASHAYALVFVFHGASGNAAQSHAWGLQDAGTAAHEAIVVFPNGIAFQNYGIGWDDRSDGYDLPFFDHMLKDLKTAYCVDAARVFAAGFSWGGDFAVALACHRGDELTAIAINSATDEFKDKSDYLTYRNLPCATHHPPALRFQHAESGDAEYPPPYFKTTSRLLQYLNTCSTTASPVPAGSSSACVAYPGCRNELVECTYDPRLGHVVPPNWARDTWDFFSSDSVLNRTPAAH
jgi:poly(3-hydroxybutyrate) depolymerase